MSYGSITPCWNCKYGANGDGSCKDAEKIQAGINSCYQTPGEHKGAGNILMQCTKLEQNIK